MRKANKIVRITEDTHKQLSEVGKFGDTFDDIIKMLLLEHAAHEKARKAGERA